MVFSLFVGVFDAIDLLRVKVYYKKVPHEIYPFCSFEVHPVERDHLCFPECREHGIRISAGEHPLSCQNSGHPFLCFLLLADQVFYQGSPDVAGRLVDLGACTSTSRV